MTKKMTALEHTNKMIDGIENMRFDADGRIYEGLLSVQHELEVQQCRKSDILLLVQLQIDVVKDYIADKEEAIEKTREDIAGFLGGPSDGKNIAAAAAKLASLEGQVKYLKDELDVLLTIASKIAF